MNASERETTAGDVEATAAGAETPNGRTSSTKVRPPKKKTSKVWNHYTEIFVEETADDLVIKKPMAACNYCDDVLCASSKQEFCEINLKIIEWLKSNDDFVVTMAKSMKEKFDKYWEMSNIALAVACFLDPRYKMKVVEFYYSEMSDDYGFDDTYEFKKVLQKIYDSYSSFYASAKTSNGQQAEARTTRTTRTSHCYVDLNEEPRRKRLNSFLRDNTGTDQEQSELDQYNCEPLLSWKDGEYFDILSWWKSHSGKYPIIAQIARDVLAIPATTVASESAFSSGGRVVSKYRSSLDPQVVEALIYSNDWIRASRIDQSGVFSILDDLAGDCIIDEVQQVEGATVDVDANIVDQEAN